MQSRQDSPPPSSRPSLLAADPQEQNDSQRLLAGIDAGAAPRPVLDQQPVKRRRRTAWVAGLLVLAAGGGTAAWMASAPDEQVAVVRPAPVRAPVTPVAAPKVEAPEVSTAAILQDTPAADEKVAAAPARPASKADTSELTALLEAKPVHAAKPEYKAARPHDEAPTHAERLAARERAKNAAEKHPLARDVLAKKKPAPEIDSDVALLAALVAHGKVSQRLAPAPDARKLKECKTRPTADEAEACRARICARVARSNAACKPASATQVVDAS